MYTLRYILAVSRRLVVAQRRNTNIVCRSHSMWEETVALDVEGVGKQ